ncbi:MAG: DUF4391 domain-containing protein [Rubricoccaceae bacterium]
MTAAELIDALALPVGAFVDRRVPKTLLVENGAPTAADKRAIQEGIEEVRWVAAVKPTTAGVPAYRDGEREYLEIAVLRLALREGAKKDRLVELVHRSIPYPVVLVVEEGGAVSISLVEKRSALNEAGRVVLDGDLVEAVVDGDTPTGILSSFLEALSLARQPRDSMRALYTGWADAVTALNVSRLTGRFVLPDTPEYAAGRREALKEIVRLDGEIAAARRAAAKEKQMARRADLNLEHARLKAAREAALKNL